MALATLENTTWKLKYQLNSYPGGTYQQKTYSINITTSEALTDAIGNPVSSFTDIAIGYDSGAEQNEVDLTYGSEYYEHAILASGDDVKALPDPWLVRPDVYFTITGGTDVTNSVLISWFEENATPYSPPIPDIVISYSGEVIATMEESGVKILKTSGKYCTDDITLTFTKQGGGGSVEIAEVTVSGISGAVTYTDASMTVVTTENSFTDVGMPVGSLVVYKDSGAPGPYPFTTKGLTSLWSYKASRDMVTISAYEVTG